MQSSRLQKFNQHEARAEFSTRQPTGVHLLAQYWAEKYPSRMHLIEKKEYLLTQLATLKQSDKDIRVTFFYDDKKSGETIPLTYLRDHGQDCLVCPDSKGNKALSTLIAEIHNQLGLKIIIIDQQQKSALTSQHLNALIIGRNSTAKDKKTGNYRLEKLAENWLRNAKENGPYYSIPLEDEIILSPHKMNIHHYLEIKSIQLADIMEIQFYLNQLKDIFKNEWTTELREDFITGAKKALRAQGSILLDRPGLHEYAENYLQKHFFQPTNLFREFNKELTNIIQKQLSLKPKGFMTERVFNISDDAKNAIIQNLKFILVNTFNELLRDSSITQQDWQLILGRQEAMIHYFENNFSKTKQPTEMRVLAEITNANHATANDIRILFKSLLTDGITTANEMKVSNHSLSR